MPRFVVLHDRRMEGGVPARPDVGIVNLDATTPLARAFGAIKAWAQPHRLRALFILAHGKASYNDEKAGFCTMRGGAGLTLGKERVLHSNVGMWSAIRGCVENIVVYSCRAAMTAPQDVGTGFDGRYLMGALAIHTGAAVFASEEIQSYHRLRGHLLHGRIDIDPWSGRVFKFGPEGGSPQEVEGARTELIDVMAGR